MITNPQPNDTVWIISYPAFIDYSILRVDYVNSRVYLGVIGREEAEGGQGIEKRFEDCYMSLGDAYEDARVFLYEGLVGAQHGNGR